MPLPLTPDESPLRGTWCFTKGQMLPDATAQRIQALLEQQLRFVAAAESGWARLYQNPVDGCYWELSFPHSELPEGGSPTLTHLSQADATLRYSLV
ncbi:Imm27 family immunity protein [Hymenobacter sp. HD11105]